MSEEEKEAIEYLERDLILYHYNTQLCSEHYTKIILNLIKKQQKEIEELTKITKTYNAFPCNKKNQIIIADKEYFNRGYFNKNFISKDKIKEKLEYQNMLWNTPNRQKEYNQEFAELLEEILEE